MPESRTFMFWVLLSRCHLVVKQPSTEGDTTQDRQGHRRSHELAYQHCLHYPFHQGGNLDRNQSSPLSCRKMDVRLAPSTSGMGDRRGLTVLVPVRLWPRLADPVGTQEPLYSKPPQGRIPLRGNPRHWVPAVSRSAKGLAPDGPVH